MYLDRIAPPSRAQALRATPTPVPPRQLERLQPPPGWSARAGFRQADPGERSNRVLHAATIPMTSRSSDYGSDVAAQLRADDALVVLLEFGPESAGTALFAAQGLPTPTPAQYDPNMLQRTLSGQAGYQRFFSVDGRPMSLYVVIGSHARRARTAPRVAALLRTVDLARGAFTLRGAA